MALGYLDGMEMPASFVCLTPSKLSYASGYIFSSLARKSEYIRVVKQIILSKQRL
jgi:hypothetical protein